MPIFVIVQADFILKVTSLRYLSLTESAYRMESLYRFWLAQSPSPSPSESYAAITDRPTITDPLL